MKKFLKKLALFCTPFFILLIIGFNLDILKVFKSYDNYYDNDNLVALNRTLVSTKIFKKTMPLKTITLLFLGVQDLKLLKQNHGKSTYLKMLVFFITMAIPKIYMVFIKK
ncbi:hypothetical protein [Lacinutrix sp.]|uniref:hypothetical protein n=1 Tax=Lacinutrix sp. TaxID=1937692 RepID=UPI00262B4170|nr:hypothetical protein [Lacinutrix sp.]MDG1715176.1 hypothetical protein [Lacinutrix sp.]